MVRVMAESLRTRLIRHSWIGFGGLVNKPLDAELTKRWVKPIQVDAGVRRDTARFVGEVRPPDLVDVATRLGGFGKPVRIVWGEADRFFTIETARRLRDAFGPSAELVEVPGGRTFLSLDEPDRVAQEIRTVSYARD
jgi:pimeloyl-ACP methyl ester carboxylesterase